MVNKTINPNWKVARKGYRGAHYWIESILGKPKFCTKCGDNSDRRYHWANISGEYKQDVMDWVRLCVPCHSRMDLGNICKKGHTLTEENTYHHPTGGRMCRICKSAYGKKWFRERREAQSDTKR